MAVIAHRAGKYAGFEFDENAASSFGDGENIADYAAKAVSELYKAKIVNGKDNGFCPLDYTTRAEAAVIIISLIRQGITKTSAEMPAKMAQVKPSRCFLRWV